ncbi:multiple epidermal growth factor-like domains protein 10, partial [Anneissia japonica]|uniref:multiple epidermal growth factor-like domains protein 10 n=1 Tax=Anneissia japonica TaxID=1529436 RepID=UPI001425583B
MKFRTMTVGIGESATISLSEDGGFNDLRWRHNYGDVIQMWNGNSSVTIKNIRATDDGVYECYGSDSRDDNRGIMRLIVRDCPLPKWSPPECEMDCPVCYNGGVCDDKSGQCICPAGFKGEYCQTSCGSNNWGRDCDVVCSTGNDEACKGKLFCPPDPFGCTCINGYKGDDCNTACANNHYGADCRQVCHCDSGGCDRKTGDCTSGSSCSIYYTGPACQDCPLPKWSPPECEMDCPVCYNSGVCDDKSGQCICPAGFKGEYCQTSCGSNNWGRDCDVVCSTGNDEACKGKLFCPPDPFGCTCIDGYGGNDCNTGLI